MAPNGEPLAPALAIRETGSWAKMGCLVWVFHRISGTMPDMRFTWFHGPKANPMIRLCDDQYF